jgi:membrane-bound lytic murein transglycosylase B
MPVLVRFRYACAGVLLAIATAVAATPPEVDPPDAAHVAFAESLARDHGLDANVVLATLAKAQYQQSIIDAITRPAEAKPWKDYRPIFLTDKRRTDGIAFYREHRELIDRAAAEHGVPPQIIVAIIGVETSYGRVTGKYRVLDALTTLAFHYPPREKFFRSELEQLFLLGDGRLAYPIDELKGSYAGAMGWGQFMPSSIAKYARDYDGDDRIDLWNSLPDVTASVASYFRGYGWETGGPVATRAQPDDDARVLTLANSEPVYPVEQLVAWGYAPLVHLDPQRPATLLKLEGERGPEYWITFQNFYVITRYNRSPLYAMSVMLLADQIAEGVAEDAPAATPVAARDGVQ